MPQTRVIFYAEVSGEVPVLQWLGELRWKDAKACALCGGDRETG